jgi:hypothetical protein
MPIALKCTCGKSLRTPDELAGKKVRCPGCQSVVVVPVPVVLAEPIVDVKPPPLPAPAVRAQTPPEVLPVAVREDEEDLPMVVLPARRKESDKFAVTDEPTQRRRRTHAEEDALVKIRRRGRDVRERDREKSNPFLLGFNAGIGGGVVMMFVAVAWFCGGLLLADMIYFYPPVMFIIGLGAFIRGIVTALR